jgi:hypothetical protein
MISLESKHFPSDEVNFAGEGFDPSAQSSPANAAAHQTGCSPLDLSRPVDPPNRASVSDTNADTSTDGRGGMPNHGMRIMNWFDLEFELAHTFRPLLDLPWLNALWTRVWFRALATFYLLGCTICSIFLGTGTILNTVAFCVLWSIILLGVLSRMDRFILRKLWTTQNSFEFVYLLVVASLCMIFQIVEINLNAAQVQHRVDGGRRIGSVVVVRSCLLMVLLWIGSCLAISADAFVFYNQRVIKAIIVLMYNAILTNMIYTYLFKWQTDGSPAVCILHPWYSTRMLLQLVNGMGQRVCFKMKSCASGLNKRF